MKAFAFGAALLLHGAATAAAPDPWHDRARTMLAHAVEVPTVAGRGRVPELARYFADQFRSAGWAEGDIHVLPYAAGKGDDTAALIVRWPAAGQAKARPILLMGHMDVVEAKREDWTTDPFRFIEKGGYYYGRGVLDMKAGEVSIITALLKLRASGFRPTRDLVLSSPATRSRSAMAPSSAQATGANGPTPPSPSTPMPAAAASPPTGGRSASSCRRPRKASPITSSPLAQGRPLVAAPPRQRHLRSRPCAGEDRAYRFQPVLNETTRAYFRARQAGERGPLGDAMRAWLANPADGAAADRIEAIRWRWA